MRRRRDEAAIALVAVGVLVVVLLLVFSGSPTKRHGARRTGECWTPVYASTHTLFNQATFDRLGKSLPLGSRHCPA